MTSPELNNIQLLRLLFAVQVVVVHARTHLGLDMDPSLSQILSRFSGVPAFFFVSGFLIYWSCRRQSGWNYAANRVLRIYPALFPVVIGSVLINLIDRGISDLTDNWYQYLKYVVGSLTLYQTVNPPVFHGVGLGIVNGALWTITVELIFYAIVPLIIWAERYCRLTVPILISISYGYYVFGESLTDFSIIGKTTLHVLLSLTPLKWGWMFGLGILAVQHFERIRPWLCYAPLVFVPAIALMWHGTGPLFRSLGNEFGLVYFVAYALLILWLAFETPSIRLAPDFSYGTYVWHMPIFNLVVILGLPFAPVVALGLTAIAAASSWYLVEQPALRLKRRNRPETTGAPVLERSPSPTS